MNIAKSTSYLTTVKAVNNIIGFASLAYFTKMIGAEQIGIYFLFHTIVAVLTTLSGFGINGAVMKRISEGNDPARFLSSGIVLKSIPLAIASFAVFFSSGALTGYIGADFTILIVIATVFDEYSSLMLRTVEGELKVAKTAVIQLSKQLTYVVVGVILIHFGYEARAIAYGLTSGYVVMFLFANYRRKTPIGRPSLVEIRSLWRYARHNYVTSLGSFTHNWMDVLILGFFVTKPEIAAYEIAWRVSSILLIVTRAFSYNIVPQVSLWDNQGEHSRIGQFVANGFIITLLFAIPGSIGMAILSEDILTLVFDISIAEGATVLIILAGGKWFENISHVIGRVLMGLNRPKLGARASIVMLTVNLGLNVILIPAIGIKGAAIGTVTSFAIATAVLGSYLTTLTTTTAPLKEVVYIILASIFMGLILLIARRYLPVDTLLVLASYVLVGVLSYTAAVFVIQPLRRRTVDGLRELSSA